MAWQSGRIGLGAQHRRTSLIRPNRASSWNISVIGAPWAQSWRILRISSGSFFPVLLRLGVALRMLLVGCELAPAVPVQQVVDRRQCHRPAQGRLQQRLDFGNHQHAAGARAIQKRPQYVALPLRGEVRVVSSATRRRAAIADYFTSYEGVAQATRPADRQPN